MIRRLLAWPLLLLPGGLALWALLRWKAASDMHVPLDLAFKHPFTKMQELRDSLNKGAGQLP
jgi:hypothetical protein